MTEVDPVHEQRVEAAKTRLHEALGRAETHRKIMSAFSKESEFEAAVIHELRQRGWGDADVIQNPSEADLLANWKHILFENNRGINLLNEVPD